MLYCDLSIISNISIPELPQSNLNEAGIVFNLDDVQPLPMNLPWSYHWCSPSGNKLLSYCNHECYHWLRFPNLADFRITIDAKEISCHPLPGVPDETIRHLLLDQVLPRCLAYQGRVIVHSSAVRVDRGAILFLGDSGAGKSTLAGDFHQAGNPIISDDCVWIKEGKSQIVAVPSYGGLRLLEDSLRVLYANEKSIWSMAHYSSKKRISLNHSGISQYKKGIPILGIIILSPPDKIPLSEIVLDRLPPRESFIVLMKQSFQLNVMDYDRIKRYSGAVGRIVTRLPAYRLSIPHDYALLPLVRQKILDKVL